MTNLVAVYGTLRKGQGNHRLLAHVKEHRLGTVDGFKMYHLGGFPALQHDVGTAVVEVYEVDQETMRSLDWLEGYRGKDQTNFYNREITEVNLESGEVVDAWIYFIDDDMQHRSVIESGDWVKDR